MEQIPMTRTAGQNRTLTALAVGAHPDDIEFMMAGTLILLQRAGVKIHMWNLANGNCGTATHTRKEIIRLRWKEAQASAKLIGAALHRPLTDDIMIYFDPALTARVAAVVRQVKPDILLLPSPQDYMEDHQNTCRLLVTAAFVRGMTGFTPTPRTAPWGGEVTLYHALPYGLRDGLRQLVRPGQYVNIASVLSDKREMLAQHRTQKEWLDVSQGVDAYLNAMEDMCRQVGKLSVRFKVAEGWRRHSHLGFCAENADPLKDILGPLCMIDRKHEDYLEQRT
jgi:LmbE family N-acetylglucosaminyl deacetylase